MKKHIENVQEFMVKAGQETPKSLTVPNETTRLLRAKLLMEEALEMCSALGVSVSSKNDSFIESINDLCFYAKGDVNLTEIADAAVDILWVGVTCPMVDIGCADKLEECINEVDRSNLSKFVDGYKCPESSKWIKGPSYSPANIKGIINSEI